MSRAEDAILGTVMMLGKLPLVTLERKLRPAHFEQYEARKLWARMLEMHDAGLPISTVTLPEGDQYAAYVPNLNDVDAYVDQILEQHRWRERRRAGVQIVTAADSKDEGKFAEAEKLLVNPSRVTTVWSRERLQDELIGLLDQGEIETFPLPFKRLNELVPLKRGGMTIVGGWTSNGKTAWVDQCARHWHSMGLTVGAWINEMTPIERAQRQIAAISGIDLSLITRGNLRPDQYSTYTDALAHIPFFVVDATGWDAQEISRDIRQRRPDVAIVDILHLIPYRDERDLAGISQILNACAKQADCHVLATAHLNEKFVIGTARPQPHLGTLKGASSLKQDADNVLFVFREDDIDTGLPTNKGQIYFGKARGGQVGGSP